jgi:hypothetical protein
VTPLQKKPDLLKGPRDCRGPKAYEEALTYTKITLFTETCPEDVIKEEDQNLILEELTGVSVGLR